MSTLPPDFPQPRPGGWEDYEWEHMEIPTQQPDYRQQQQQMGDRITEMLQKRIQRLDQPSYGAQDILSAGDIAAERTMANILAGTGGAVSYSDVLEGRQAPQEKRELQQLQSAQALYDHFETQRQLGSENETRVMDVIGMITSDPMAQAKLLEMAHNDPDTLDPSNRAQLIRKFAGYAKSAGIETDVAYKRRMEQARLEQDKISGLPAGLEVSDRLTSLRQSAQQAEIDGDIDKATELWTQYNEVYTSNKLGEKGTMVTGEGITDAPGYNEFLKRREEAKAEGKGAGELTTKKLETIAGDRLAIRQLDNSQKIVEQEVADAIRLIREQTALGRVAFKDIPLTEARALQGALDTIRANIGFDKLQAMRQASKTGGALGQVSEFENRLLQATQGMIDVSLPLDELIPNLEQVVNTRRQTFLDLADKFSEFYEQGWDERARPEPEQFTAMPQIEIDEDTKGLLDKYAPE